MKFLKKIPRKTYIRVFFLILFLCSILSSCSKDKNKLTFAVSAKIYPFEYYENNKLEGFDIELGKLIGKELGKEVVFKDIYYYNIFTSIQNNHVDASISSHIITKKRAEQFLFSKIYQKSEPTFVFNSKYNNFSKLSELKSKRISPFYGSMFNKWFKENLGDSVQKIYYNDEMSAMKALENNSIDLILLEKFEAIYLTKKNPNIKILKFEEPLKFYVDEENYELGLGIIVKKQNQALMKKINCALEKLEKEGKIEELREKFLKED